MQGLKGEPLNKSGSRNRHQVASSVKARERNNLDFGGVWVIEKQFLSPDSNSKIFRSTEQNFVSFVNCEKALDVVPYKLLIKLLDNITIDVKDIRIIEIHIENKKST